MDTLSHGAQGCCFSLMLFWSLSPGLGHGPLYVTTDLGFRKSFGGNAQGKKNQPFTHRRETQVSSASSSAWQVVTAIRQRLGPFGRALLVPEEVTGLGNQTRHSRFVYAYLLAPRGHFKRSS